jgi:hypothetical protein
MSWAEAQKEAERWLIEGGVPLGKIKGQYFDLHDKVETLPENTGYRLMVLRAAKRIMAKREARVWLPDFPE